VDEWKGSNKLPLSPEAGRTAVVVRKCRS